MNLVMPSRPVETRLECTVYDCYFRTGKSWSTSSTSHAQFRDRLMEDLNRDDICDWVTEDEVWWEAELVGSESMGTECSNCKTLHFCLETCELREGSLEMVRRTRW